ncbi:GNAT family N-acetyltransferase [Frigidibacter sp. RF13]|uniref:GNAT family N-acetyltransferase n=1 Tax=Frigidibacter sp. RF13 TaxID=2997340 RepID=UPI00227093D4|nr:GNAT family N-acetyltransferase [Frigidibacter sp. RF13]MCY1126811.1 GNAT family N-acetyltransferase [Frigidibacter sp. RF13]
MHTTIDDFDIRIADPESDEARACLNAYFDLLVERVDGMMRSHVPDPDPHAAAFRRPGGTFLLACRRDAPVGCVSLKTLSPGVGEIKRLWVDASARGHGLARLLMHRVEAEARALGLHRLQLDTSGVLTEAIALYRSEGWTDIPAYSGFPATHWFGKIL